jgi:hypothetical protein
MPYQLHSDTVGLQSIDRTIFLYLSKSYRRLVLKTGFVVGLIIAMGTMVVIPSPMGQVAKAITCSIMFANHVAQFSSKSTFPGSCSVATAISQKTAIIGAGPIDRDSKSTCLSASSSFTPNTSNLNRNEGNGAVSCSSHSP